MIPVLFFLALAASPPPVAALAPGESLHYLPAVTARETVRWRRESMPLKVYIRPGLPQGDGCGSELDTYVKEGLRWWALPMLQLKLRYRISYDPRQADIMIIWARQARHPALLGETRYIPEGQQHFVTPLTTTLACRHFSGTPLTPVEIRRLAAHEFGHALGLWGHSDQPRDIMYPQTQVSQVSGRDFNTLKQLYALPAARVNVK